MDHPPLGVVVSPHFIHALRDFREMVKSEQVAKEVKVEDRCSWGRTRTSMRIVDSVWNYGPKTAHAPDTSVTVENM